MNSAPLFDTHCHLDEPSLQAELPSLLEMMETNGLVGCLTIGTNRESSRNSIELARQSEKIYPAVGIHPNYVTETQQGDWEAIVELAEQPDIKAVGETGLDLYWKTAPLDLQIDYFEKHLQLSRAIGKPFIVHCRDAETETREVLSRAAVIGPLNGVMHSFCGSLDMALQCVEWGMLISFSGMLTYKRNDELREIARQLPADRILVETDSPYLSPMPYRGKRNQPAYVKHTAEVLAQVREVSYADICKLTTENAFRFLQI